jgi:ABC-2 type transport system ATP-binding protein
VIAKERPTPLLEVRGLNKSYGQVEALAAVSFSVGRGEVVGLIGPNGAGKTTLLECLAGLLSRDAGDVVLTHDSVSGTTSPATCFYVPDGIAPWESRRVDWTLQFFAALHGRSADTRQVVEELALGALLHQSMGSLSRGQRKRVLIAMGLLTGAPLLLLDEPFDGLDVRQARDIARVLRARAAGGRAMLLSIHQLADAARVCDRMVLLSGGRIVGAGTLDELRQAAGLADASLEEIFLALT